MNSIIISMGSWGVEHVTGNYEVNKRINNPAPGDVVYIQSNGEYPFTTGKDVEKWRVDSIRDGRAILVRGGSFFLHKGGGCSVSGGPFWGIPLDELKFSYRFEEASFWNWGNNLPGADMAVGYSITRPVYTYTP